MGSLCRIRQQRLQCIDLQRKGGVLRKGFTLLMAIILMLLIGTIMGLMLSFSTFTSKQTADIYLREQAQIIARSVTELALLGISGNDWNGGDCINDENDLNISSYKGFDISLDIAYYGNGFPATCNQIIDDIYTKESNGTIRIDTYVTYIDPNTNEQIRYHRRTLQKP
jgi:type II secretory pathway pseudopilin PulG